MKGAAKGATKRTTASFPAAMPCSPPHPRTNWPKSSRRASLASRPSLRRVRRYPPPAISATACGRAGSSPPPPTNWAETERAPLPRKPPEPAPRPALPAAGNFSDRLWKGWIVPAADSDTWFAAGTTAYHDLLQSDDLEKALEALRIQHRGLKLAPDNAMNRFRIEEGSE